MSEFDYVFETPYDNQNLTAFTCTIDRPSNPTSPDSMMYVMNHFLYGVLNIGSTAIEVPQPDNANVTNGQSLSDQANQCKSTFGRQPNFLEVDFYDQGQCFQTLAALNGVTYTPKTLGTSTGSASGAKTTIQNSAPSSITLSYFTVGVATVAAVLVANL